MCVCMCEYTHNLLYIYLHVRVKYRKLQKPRSFQKIGPCMYSHGYSHI